jgi:hypothetical protein
LPRGLNTRGFNPHSSRNKVPGLRARFPNVLCFGSISRTCLLSLVNTYCMDAFCASSMDGFVGTRPRVVHCLGPELLVPCTGTSSGQWTTRVCGSACPSICHIPYVSCLSPSLPCLYRSMVRANPNRSAHSHPQSLGMTRRIVPVVVVLVVQAMLSLLSSRNIVKKVHSSA